MEVEKLEKRKKKKLWEHAMNFIGIIIIAALLYAINEWLLLIGAIVYLFALIKYFRDRKKYYEIYDPNNSANPKGEETTGVEKW